MSVLSCEIVNYRRDIPFKVDDNGTIKREQNPRTPGLRIKQNAVSTTRPEGFQSGKHDAKGNLSPDKKLKEDNHHDDERIY